MIGGLAPLLRPGDKAGRYELLLQIAQGGMGAVWVARLRLENGFEKLFAVKTLLTHLSGQAVFRDMFLDEARMAAAIEHPNVAQILDLGEQGELLYLVMEWVEGESLNALARATSSVGGHIPHGVLLRILADACSGLHAVHEHAGRDGRVLEIVHRDVSPHNMLVSTRGVTKVIDFGVAKSRDRLAGATESGNVKGKLRYMAPEQACGRPVDRRADVWGVGAVLYSILTGRYVYSGDSDVDILREMVSGRVPDITFAPGAVPAPIERVLRRALSVDPEGRHPTASALSDDLDAAARELGQLTTQQGVAAFVEATSGPRIARIRAAIHASLDESDELYSTVRRRSSPSSPHLTPTQVTPSADVALAGEPQTHSGTLGSSALDRRSMPPQSKTPTVRLALLLGGALALIGGAAIFFTRARTDKAPIPSASASPAERSSLGSLEDAPSPSVSPRPLPLPQSPSAAAQAPPEDATKVDLDVPVLAPRASASAVVVPKPPVSHTPVAPPATNPKKKQKPAIDSIIDTRR